jgi:hypothetical protein
MMTKAVRFRLLVLMTVVSICSAAGLKVRAQDRERFVISAQAGGVNLVVGEVRLWRKGETASRVLNAEDDLASGDRVKTGADGRLELLLNPGSYLRLAENSELELQDSSLDHLRLKLSSGTAIVEATGSHDLAMLTEVVTPQTGIEIVKSGLYRINVLPNGITEVRVRKGRALVGAASMTVKEGHKAIVSSGNVEVAKYNTQDEDPFDLWSRDRAETLTAANLQLAERDLNPAFAGYASTNSYYYPSWYASSFGFWIYNPFRRCHTFLPFRSSWRSPYGFRYHYGLGDHHRFAPIVANRATSSTTSSSKAASSNRTAAATGKRGSGRSGGSSKPGHARSSGGRSGSSRGGRH